MLLGLELSQLIGPSARIRCSDGMIRLGIHNMLHIYLMGWVFYLPQRSHSYLHMHLQNELLDRIILDMNKNQQPINIYTDFSKAFDT